MPKAQIARELHFDTIDDMLADAKRIAAQSDAATRGNWNAAENIWHVARYLQASVEGYPFTPPLFFRMIGPFLKKGLISKTMRSGFKTPEMIHKHMEPGGSEVGEITMDRAIGLLEEWVGKANEQGYIPRNPAFGTMDRQQWTDLHCRHAELHFGLIEIKD